MVTERFTTRTLLLAVVGFGIVIGVAGTVTLGPVVDDYTTSDPLASTAPATAIQFEYDEANRTMEIHHVKGDVLNESNVDRVYVTVNGDLDGVVVESDDGINYNGVWATDNDDLGATDYPITDEDSVTVVGVVEDDELRPLEPGEQVDVVADLPEVSDTLHSEEVPE